MPSPKDPDNLSISRTASLSELEVWAHCDDEIGASTGRRAIARGDLLAPLVRTCSHQGFPHLDVRPDEPPPRHAVIHRWPPFSETDARKSVAQQLRAQAKPIAR